MFFRLKTNITFILNFSKMHYLEAFFVEKSTNIFYNLIRKIKKERNKKMSKMSKIFNGKKIIKILAIIIILASMNFVFMTKVNAGDTDDKEAKNISITDIINAGKTWLDNGKDSQPTGTGVDDFAESFVGVGQVLVAIGIVTLLIVTLITAIKWITATPDKQAKLKQQLIGLVISAVVIFGAIGIWNLVRGIMNNVETKLGTGSSQVQQINTKI